MSTPDGPRTSTEIAGLERACADERGNASARAAARAVKKVKIEEACACAQLGSALAHLGPAERRRGIDHVLWACEDGANRGCDEFVLVESLCLVDPDMPECDLFRELELAPRERLPLDAMLGCHARAGAVLCLTKTDVYVRDRDRAWSTASIKRWQRDDTRREARWAADIGSSRLVITRGAIVETAWSETLPPGEIAPLSARLRDEAVVAMRELKAMLRACDERVVACWRAAEDVLVPPAERYDMGPIIDAPTPSGSLAGCREEGTRVVSDFGRRSHVFSKKPLAMPAVCAELAR